VLLKLDIRLCGIHVEAAHNSETQRCAYLRHNIRRRHNSYWRLQRLASDHR
jgi:hypothetical protein